MKNLKVLSNEELVVMVQNAGENSVEGNAIIAELMKRMEGMMVQFANKYVNIPNKEFEDKVGELTIQLLKAIRDFDSEKGWQFTTLCRAYFTQGMDKLYQIETRGKRHDPNVVLNSYEALVEIKQDGNVEDADMQFSTEYETYNDVEVKDLLDRLQLTEKERITCTLLMEGKNKSSIARVLGVTPMAITNYTKKIQSQLRLAGVC